MSEYLYIEEKTNKIIINNNSYKFITCYINNVERIIIKDEKHRLRILKIELNKLKYKSKIYPNNLIKFVMYRLTLEYKFLMCISKICLVKNQLIYF